MKRLITFIKRHGRFNVLLALDIAGQVAAALGAAQKEQIVHRDIKPTNLMLNFAEERVVHVKVIDFGLARSTSGIQSEAALSEPGIFAGTALFASPEQCAGGEVDTRSDIYSLGVTLWEMLTGKVPFSGTTTEVIRQHLSAPLPLEQLEHVPKPVVALLQSMLEKDLARRPQDPSALQSELDAVKKALRSPENSRSLDLTGSGRKVDEDLFRLASDGWRSPLALRFWRRHWWRAFIFGVRPPRVCFHCEVHCGAPIR